MGVQVYVEAPIDSEMDVQQILWHLRDKHKAEVRKAVLLVWFDAETPPEQDWRFDHVDVR